MRILLIFLFSLLPQKVGSLVLERPCCSSYLHVSAAFGAKLSASGLRNMEIVKVDPFDACSPLKPDTDLRGKVALIERGQCNFTDKVLRVQRSNASAAIVMDNMARENWGIIMKGDDDASAVDIPAIFISQKAGDAILKKLEISVFLAQSVLVTLNHTGEVEFRMKQLGFVKSAFIYVIVSFVLFVFSSCSCVFIAAFVSWFQKNARSRASKRLQTKKYSKLTIEKSFEFKQITASRTQKDLLADQSSDGSKYTFEGGENEASCCICLDEYEEGDALKVLPCKHEFHANCINPWLEQKSGLCPLCKQDALPHVTAYTELNGPLDQIADAFYDHSCLCTLIMLVLVTMCVSVALTSGFLSL